MGDGGRTSILTESLVWFVLVRLRLVSGRGVDEINILHNT